MKKLQTMSIVIVLTLLTACAYTTVTRETVVASNYSFLGVHSFSVNLDCAKSKATNVYDGFTKNFCPVLENTVRIIMKERHPRLSYVDTGADLIVDITLEELNGGSVGLRKSGLGMGDTLITVFIRILKKDQVVAQTRFDMKNKIDDVYFGDRANESVLLRAVRGVAEFVSNFVDAPKEQTIRE